MTLGELAAVLDVPPRWVQNAVRQLGGTQPFRYSYRTSQQLYLARLIHETAGMTLPRAYQLSKRILAEPPRHRNSSAEYHREVSLTIDRERVVASFLVAWARMQIMYRPKQRGRPRRRRMTPKTFGVDLGSLRENLRRTPTERLQALQNAHDFFRAAVREA